MSQIDSGNVPNGRCWTLSFVNGEWRQSGELAVGVIAGTPKFVASDFDGDGIDELAIADDTPIVRFFKNEGGEWHPAQTVSLSAPVDFMTTADTDADGAAELIVHTVNDPSKGVVIPWIIRRR